MDILFVGRWLMAALGAAAVLVALFVIVRPPASHVTHPLWPLAFGGLFVGTGVFGLEFMPQYRLWVESLTKMVETGSVESYEEFFAGVGAQKLPPAIQEVGVNYAISNPVKGMDAVLTEAIAKAPDNSQGEKALTWAKDSYAGKQLEITRLVEDKASVESAKGFAPVTIRLMHDRIIDMPEADRKRLGIDPNAANTFKKLIRRFPGSRGAAIR